MKEFKYTVYVRCITYNQVSYIKDAMDGFCMQETDFPYVCVIFDDNSTDGAQGVIKNYLQENFDLTENGITLIEDTDDYFLQYVRHKFNHNCYFVVVFLKYNHWILKKAKDVYVNDWLQKSKYIANCEGDDYWIDKTKLQKQVDAMEKNPKIGLCYTNSYTLIQKRHKLIKPKTDFSYKGLKELIYVNPIMTLTTIYRQSCLSSYINEINPSSHGWLMGDYPKWIWFAANTEVYHLDMYTAVYRQCDNSVSHSTNAEKQIAFLKSINNVQHFFAEKYFPQDDNLKIKIDDRTNSRMANVYDVHGNRIKYLEFAKKVSEKNKNMKKNIFLYSNPLYYSIVRILRAMRKKIVSLIYTYN